MLTKKELTPHAMELFRRVKLALPAEISERLGSNRLFYTHTDYRTLFLFDVWDSNQTDVLSKKHFKYCLGYDKRPGATREGYFHLWLMRIRIYGKHEAIRKGILATLDRELPRVIPDGFIYYPHDRAFDYKWEFDYPKNLGDLPDILLPRYVSLISAVHPVLMPLIDQFTSSLLPGERRAIVARRGRIPFTPSGVRDRELVREYTRSISPSWRLDILKQHEYRCANPSCRADLQTIDHHIDHIIPFSKGGTTTRENLQPLCARCNLAKGNRS